MRAVRGDLVIRRARLAADSGTGPGGGVAGARVADVRVAGGRIVEVRTSVGLHDADEELYAAGGWLVPGLHDHHIHLRAMAASRSSIRVGPREVTVVNELQEVLRRANDDGGSGWIRAVGYHESVAGELDRDVLDRMVPDRPLRVQHRSGILWVLNSTALDLVGAESDPASGVERDSSGRPTGRLWRMDEWLAQRTASLPDRELLARLRELSREAAAFGVTGWTDATPDRTDADTDLLAGAAAGGAVRQRLHLMVRPGAPAAASEPHRPDRVTTGAVKVILDDFDLPSIDSLSREFGEAHRAGRPVAVHCVTRAQLVVTLAALDEAGPVPRPQRDRIEHGAVIPPELIGQLKRLGVVVVTQPNFVAERGDEYLRSAEPEEVENLWRAGSLVRAGVCVAAGTDAPFGGPDPWAAIRAATTRRTAAGVRFGRDEHVELREALNWWWGTGDHPEVPRQVRAGEVADLVVLEAPGNVVATLIAGEVVHG